ncbi:hypothetical protein AZH53_06735 [Methanomicrobiaceae archaeon CYW5]|nr:hypothetical protein [Methanovulcanius yangii]
MNSYISRDLKRQFSPKEGWMIEKTPDCGGVTFPYVVWRKRFGQTKRYPVEVVIEPSVSGKKVEEFATKIAAAKKAKIALEPLMLFVPTDADVSAIPDGIVVKYLKVLKVEDGQILWWKKTLPAE